MPTFLGVWQRLGRLSMHAAMFLELMKAKVLKLKMGGLLVQRQHLFPGPILTMSDFKFNYLYAI